MTNQKDTDQENKPPDNEQSNQNNQSWFLRLQRESWYMEMITSAFVIFLLFKVPGLLVDTVDYLKNNYGFSSNETPFITTIVISFLPFIYITTYVILFNLIVHLFLRVFWIGVIGIRSVFTNDIQFDKLDYSRYFKERLPRHVTPLQNLIQHLDNICSTIYGLSLYIIFLFISLGIWLTLFFLLAILITNTSTWALEITTGVILSGFTISGLIYFIDFITLGILRKSHKLSKAYYPLYRFYNYLTLAFVYNEIYYTYLSNIKRWKVGGVLWVFLIIVYTLMASSFDRFISFPTKSLYSLSSNVSLKNSHYENLREKEDDSKYVSDVSIPSDIVKEDFIRLFIRYHPFENDDIRKHVAENVLPRQQEFTIRPPVSFTYEQGLRFFFFDPPTPEKSKYRLMLDSLQDFYQVHLDDSLLKDLKLRYARHPEKDQPGFRAYIPVSHLSEGEHTIVVTEADIYEPDSDTGSLTIERDTFAKIPFWKAGEGTKQTRNKEAEAPKQFPNSKQQ